jgi:putative nucleotidyltransferase with HDIG domain
MASSNSHAYLQEMANSDLLFSLLPELRPLCGCMQNQYHWHDVFDHTMAAYKHLEEIAAHPRKLLAQSCTQQACKHVDPNGAVLKWSILLHDIGKAHTRSVDPQGRVHFYRHEKVGAVMADNVLRRLRFSNKQREHITALIRLHLRPLHLFSAHCQGLLKNKGLLRFYRQSAPYTLDLLVHCYADMLAKQVAMANDRNQSFLDFARSIAQDWLRLAKRSTGTTRLISGQDLIDTFDLSPSPEFRRILDAFAEYHIANPSINRRQALDWIADFIKKRGLR